MPKRDKRRDKKLSAIFFRKQIPALKQADLLSPSCTAGTEEIPSYTTCTYISWRRGMKKGQNMFSLVYIPRWEKESMGEILAPLKLVEALTPGFSNNIKAKAVTIENQVTENWFDRNNGALVKKLMHVNNVCHGPNSALSHTGEIWRNSTDFQWDYNSVPNFRLARVLLFSLPSFTSHKILRLIYVLNKLSAKCHV